MTQSAKNELKVGLLAAGTAILVVVFAWLLGVRNPFSRSVSFYLTYNFAGGIEVGSPVRVSGIKAGRVESIEFFSPAEGIVPLKMKVSIQSDAARGVRADSKFYINIAGIIGERYIEVTPGSSESPEVRQGQTLAGIDPPRIDQLISQSFDLAGSLRDLVDKNKGDITRSIELLYKMSANLNQTLGSVERSRLFQTDLQSLVNNLISITRDVRVITDQFDTPEGRKTLSLLHELLWRLEPLNSKTIRDFVQKEGVRVRAF